MADTTSRIFVQIASYRDSECQWTVKDLFEKAANPERINVGICWQFIPEEDAHCFQVETRPAQQRIIKMHALDSKGVCWARHLTQKLWNGEEYTLQIDSHMRFVPGWDNLLIEELAKCPSPNAVLSCNPPSYTPPDQLAPNPRNTVKRAKHFNQAGELICEGVPLTTAPEAPPPGVFIAAGFMFAGSRLIREFPYDPHLYFGQEEVAYSARLYTHGWDVFSPTRIMVYHYYNDGGKSGRRLHWSDVKEWTQLQKSAMPRYHHLMGYQASDKPEVTKELDKYGLGNVRTLEQFFAASGVDFRAREIMKKP